MFLWFRKKESIMENKKASPLRYVLPPLIVLFGIAILIGFTKSRSKPPKVARVFPGVLVEVITAEISNRTISVIGHGTVKPLHEINLIPQVSGKIEWVNPQFVAGGRFHLGEEILRIERIDFLLAVDQAEAAVASTEFALKLAQANADVARKDWETMQKSHQRLTGSTQRSEPDGLVLHEPQLKQADAKLASACFSCGSCRTKPSGSLL
jgi:multidrug efflux pump subunit AcrA (membrane-fusion protein)